MAIDFPASPTVGQEHVNGGMTYVWNGTGWTVKGGSTADFVLKTGDTMTGNLRIAKTAPAMVIDGPDYNTIYGMRSTKARWGLMIADDAPETGNDAGSNFSLIRYNDAGTVAIDRPLTIHRSTGIVDVKALTISGVPAAPLDAMAYNGMQVNGNMDVHQTAVGNVLFPSGTDEKYVVDGWAVSKTGTSALDTYKTTTGMGGLPNCIQLHATTPQPTIGTDAVRFVTRIEGYRIARLGWGTPNAKPITMSFWARFMLPGTYRALILNDGGSSGTAWVPFTINTSMVWQYVTVAFPAQTMGAWQIDHRIGFYLTIEVASSATPNTVSAINQYAAITGVIIIPGVQAPTAAQSPLIMRPYDQELLVCQRYYQKLGNGVLGSLLFQGYAVGSAHISSTLRLAPSMRAAPTTTKVGTWTDTLVASTTFFPAMSSIGWQLLASGTGEIGSYNNADGYLVCDARL